MRRTVMDEHLCTCACPPVSVPAWCTCTMLAQVRHPSILFYLSSIPHHLPRTRARALPIVLCVRARHNISLRDLLRLK